MGLSDPLWNELYHMGRAARLINLLVINLLVLAACSDRRAAPRDVSGVSNGPTPVMAVSVERREIADEIEAVGTTLANESISVTAKVTDTVSAVRFNDGDLVAAGDVLVELTNVEQQALLREAEADVDDAQTQLKRLEDLLTRLSVPISQVDEARARFNGAKARYQSILARLDDRLISAPFAGYLGFREVSQGTLVTPGTVITTLDDVSTIKLDFSVPEVFLGALIPGLKLNASSVAFPDERFPAEVKTISARIDPVTRATTVRAHIDNARALLRPGMLMVVKLSINERLALMVPEVALLQERNQAYVYVVDAENRAQRKDVALGQRNNGWAEVLTGLDVGELVITEGVIKVRAGEPILLQSDHPVPTPALGAH